MELPKGMTEKDAQFLEKFVPAGLALLGTDIVERLSSDAPLYEPILSNLFARLDDVIKDFLREPSIGDEDATNLALAAIFTLYFKAIVLIGKSMEEAGSRDTFLGRVSALDAMMLGAMIERMSRQKTPTSMFYEFKKRPPNTPTQPPIGGTN